MSVLQRIATAEGPSRGAVIFVHGLGGDAHDTWQRNGQPNTFWPAWLGQDFPDLDVWTFAYDASPTTWFGYAMELPDRAGNMLAALDAERLEGTPLVFVCHSLGGLLIKQLLRASFDRPGQRVGQFLHRTQGVAFLATPNSGSDVASWADKFRTLLGASAAIQDLKADTAALRDLSSWYRDHAPQEDIATLVFFETRPTRGVKIVDPSSADPGIPYVQPIAYDGDHLTIAKPASREDLVYKQVRRLVEDRLPQPAPGIAFKSKLRRVFISYRRRAQPDAKLASWLHTQLKAAGHDVFIDVGIKVGVDWSTEITRRIDWCDFLVVLLSKDAVESEMVQEEVRLAHHRRKKDDTPVILPVRVAFEGELGYALGAYIGKLQYARWIGSADDGPILAQLLEAIGTGTLQKLVDETASLARPVDAVEAVRVRPSVAADPRVLRQRPDRPTSPTDPFYLEREADRIVLPLADNTGETLVLKAPSKMGKTSLLIRYLDGCRRVGKRIAFLDFQIFSEAELDDLGVVLTGLAAQLVREMRLDPTARRTIASPSQLTEFLEDDILARLPEPLTLAFDEVDRLVERPYHNDVFAMLRGWHNRRASHSWRGWDRVDLTLVVATEPSALIRDVEQSPFNVTVPVRLDPFSQPQLVVLNDLFDQPLRDGELDLLHLLTGGQPYLTRLAFYRLGPAFGVSLRDLDATAADNDGPFGEHLRAKLTQLGRRPDLAAAMGRLVHQGVAPDEALSHRLRAAGLVRKEDGKVVPANLLYDRFFRRVLPS
ncbi:MULTISPECIES: AAA-like domain-containing protein [unclassified Mesorhizobium]|uniref:AAA-like domain-containing protein n=1 Tax=unclassified Mesorhizobium TaxID=325217 RepID=UPI000404C5CD|nr:MULTISPECIES: AAA-like domain-containing protein [unclassified Mesorhizobium]